MLHYRVISAAQRFSFSIGLIHEHPRTDPPVTGLAHTLNHRIAVMQTGPVICSSPPTLTVTSEAVIFLINLTYQNSTIRNINNRYLLSSSHNNASFFLSILSENPCVFFFCPIFNTGIYSIKIPTQTQFQYPHDLTYPISKLTYIITQVKF